MSRFVNYVEFDPAKVQISTIDVKTVQDGNTKISYRNVNLIYNYGTDDKPIPDELLLELPRVKSLDGIEERIFHGKTNWTIGARFGETEEDIMFCQKMDQMYASLRSCLLDMKSELRFNELSKSNIDFIFKNPLYRPKDKITDEIIAGKPPSCYLKLFKMEHSKTLFTDLKARPIDWKLLTNVEMEYQPLVKMPAIYVGGGKCRLQMKVLSAVVIKAVAIGTETLQTKTIERIVEKEPDRLKELEKQLRKLANREEPLEDIKEEPKAESPSEDNIDSLTSLMSGSSKPVGFGKSPAIISFK